MLVVTLAPASLQIRAAARSSATPRLRRIPACGQAARWSPSKSATAPALAGRQRKGEPQAAKQESSEEVGWVCGGLVVGNCGERSAGIWPRLGFQHCMTRRVNGLYQFCAETAVAHSRGCLLPSSAWGWCFEILVGLWRNFSVQKLIPGWWFPAVFGGDVPHCEWLLAHWLWLLGGAAGGEWWLLSGALGNGGWVGCQPKMPSKLA